jgi:hypothetical protein
MRFLTIATILLLGFGCSDKSDAARPVASLKAPPRPVDSAALEREGVAKCEEGRALVEKHRALLDGNATDQVPKSVLKADLQKAQQLIQEGMPLLGQVGYCYHTTPYQEALITARKKLRELQD